MAAQKPRRKSDPRLRRVFDDDDDASLPGTVWRLLPVNGNNGRAKIRIFESPSVSPSSFHDEVLVVVETCGLGRNRNVRRGKKQRRAIYFPRPSSRTERPSSSGCGSNNRQADRQRRTGMSQPASSTSLPLSSRVHLRSRLRSEIGSAEFGGKRFCTHAAAANCSFGGTERSRPPPTGRQITFGV